MGKCINCNNEIFIKDGVYVCDSCKNDVIYRCWKCNHKINPNDIKPIFEDQKECSWCGFFICPNCNHCGYKKDKSLCNRIELKKIIKKKFDNTGQKTKLNEAVQILGNLQQGKYPTYCIRNLPKSYANYYAKEYFCLMKGWKAKNIIDIKKFNDRYDEIINEDIGFEFTVNDKREYGSKGQEVREALNLAVCLGKIELFVNELGFWKYRRSNNNACKYWNSDDLYVKYCPVCKKEHDINSNYAVCDCGTIYKKGDKKGQLKNINLKIKTTNISSCTMPRNEFEKER